MLSLRAKRQALLMTLSRPRNEDGGHAARAFASALTVSEAAVRCLSLCVASSVPARARQAAIALLSPGSADEADR